MKISRTSGETPQNAPAPQPKTQPTPAPAPKPRCKPKPEPEYEEDDDEEEEEHRRHFPVGCLIVIIILALVGFGAYKGMQFYSEIDDAKAKLAALPKLTNPTKEQASSSMTGSLNNTPNTAARPTASSTATLRCALA